jgi:heme/copper-type cytochrome/quinol oxidase subunit 2
MTQRAKQFSGIILVTVVVVVAMAILAISGFRTSAEADEPIREIVLEAKGTAFGDDNPTLILKEGERVRIIVRNSDPGVEHSIAIPELGIERVDIAPGEEQVFEVRAGRPGVVDYICPQHLPLMQGKIVVTP